MANLLKVASGVCLVGTTVCTLASSVIDKKKNEETVREEARKIAEEETNRYLSSRFETESEED